MTTKQKLKVVGPKTDSN